MKSKALKRLVIAAVIVVAVVLAWLFRLDQYLTLQYLRDSKEHLAALYARNPGAVIGVYAAVYVAVTALSLPGAAVMTLAAGALFGLLAGTVIVSFASTTGATLAFLVSRFLLRDWVQKTFGEKLTAVNQGVEREGGFYLFTMRLIPAFPFWLINLVMGLTRMPVVTFFWVSQIGMLPGTLVYVNAGRELSRVDSLSGILSPRLVAAFVLLGIFPLVARKLIALSRKGRRDGG